MCVGDMRVGLWFFCFCFCFSGGLSEMQIASLEMMIIYAKLCPALLFHTSYKKGTVKLPVGGRGVRAGLQARALV